MARRRLRVRSQIWLVLALLLAFLVAAAITMIALDATGVFNGLIFLWSLLISYLILLIVYFILTRPTVKGWLGEKKVNRTLAKMERKYGGRFIHNVIVKGDDGRTSQIDHVYVCTKGIYVIETKNYGGRIYGTDAQREWTQVLAYGKVKNRLYNPIMQNKTHMRRLQDVLHERVDMIGIVIFLRADISRLDADGVYDLRGLRRAIAGGTAFYRERKVAQLADAIEAFKAGRVFTSSEHVRLVQQTAHKIDQGICPRCGAKLVLRTAKKNGKHFYGCSRFPKCRFTKEA